MMTAASPLIAFNPINNRTTEPVRCGILDRAERRNVRPLLLKDFPGAVGASIVDDDDLVSNAWCCQFAIEVPNRRGDATIFVASGYDDREARRAVLLVSHSRSADLMSPRKGTLHRSNAINRAVHLRFDSSALRSAHPIDEKNPVEMVVLVLNRPGQEAVRLKFNHCSVQRLRPHTNGPGLVTSLRAPGKLRQPSTPVSGFPKGSTSGFMRISGI